MAYIVTENCKHAKYTDCVEACPVEAFHEDDRMLYINPDECIDCDACVPACPVNAIYAEEDLPAKYKEWIALNAEKAAVLPVITTQKDPLPGARTLAEIEAGAPVPDQGSQS